MKKYVLIIIVIIISMPIIIYSVGNCYFSESRLIEMNWGIEIPSEFKKYYSKKTPTSFHGDGERYIIYNCNNTNVPFIENFSGVRDKSVENFVQNTLSKLSVPSKKNPNFNETYYWWGNYKKDDGSRLIILYYPDISEMYFIEEIM